VKKQQQETGQPRQSKGFISGTNFHKIRFFWDKDDRCCTVTLFESMFLEFKLPRERWKQGEQMVFWIWNCREFFEKQGREI